MRSSDERFVVFSQNKKKRHFTDKILCINYCLHQGGDYVIETSDGRPVELIEVPSGFDLKIVKPVYGV